MTKTERVLNLYTHKLFPRFSTPTLSRFSELFSKLSGYDSDSDSDQLTKIYSQELKNDANLEWKDIELIQKK